MYMYKYSTVFHVHAQNGEKPHHCAFKPDGSLVTAAYDSHVIDIWPHVESLRADSSVDNVEIKRAAQIYIKDTTHIISRLAIIIIIVN